MELRYEHVNILFASFLTLPCMSFFQVCRSDAKRSTLHKFAWQRVTQHTFEARDLRHGTSQRGFSLKSTRAGGLPFVVLYSGCNIPI